MCPIKFGDDDSKAVDLEKQELQGGETIGYSSLEGTNEESVSSTNSSDRAATTPTAASFSVFKSDLNNKNMEALCRFLDRPRVRILDTTLFVILLALIAVIVVLWYGFYNICGDDEPVDCSRRNIILIWTVHVVNIVADVLMAFTLPWRIVHFWHAWVQQKKERQAAASGDERPHAVDLCGNIPPASNFWLAWLSARKRKWISFILIVSVLFQYTSQVAVWVFYSYDRQTTEAGQFYTNVFFHISMLFLGVAILCIILEYLYYLMRRFICVRNADDETKETFFQNLKQTLCFFNRNLAKEETS